ncbi:GyrI-like domain-containing protein [Promethearchaeum syntrophicum]|uniref:GyrI-like domain-containing protein n=1 Tax=Promethearchaeum syntrophicum TaxID=2594042 RepID=A0A5B9DB52_9ARCH|nr:GyrI-like domain-containing protein [Candidatus Prometheoarchaeum syntrophicum]QEE16221.1 Bacterial transcription activator, effector binding domain [Candidatus Prometheoarchaeum syntrophicum]
MGTQNKDFIPIITEPIQLRLLGCEFYGNPFQSAGEWSSENEIGILWQRFLRYANKYKFIFEKLNQHPNYSYEIHFEPDNFSQTKKFYVFVGILIDYFDEIPLEFMIKQFPSTQYAEFTTKMTENTIAEYIFQDWLGSDKSEYTQAYPYVIQRYGIKFKGLDNPDSEIDWLIPVRKR